MKITKTTVCSPYIFSKVEQFDSIFLEELPSFFRSKEYGGSVKEIIYTEFFVHDDQPDSNKVSYDQEKNMLVCIIQPEFKKVRNSNPNRFGKLLAKTYMESSKQFSILKLQDFEFKKYIADLEIFFTQHQLL